MEYNIKVTKNGKRCIFYKLIENKEKNNNYEKICSVSLDTGDCWTCYFRPFFIAGYIKESKNRKDKKILDAILECCSPKYMNTM